MLPWPKPTEPREGTSVLFDQETASTFTVIDTSAVNSDGPVSLWRGSFVAEGAVDITLKAGATTLMTWNLGAAGSVWFDESDFFEGAAEEDITITLSAAVRVTGKIHWENRYQSDGSGNWS